MTGPSLDEGSPWEEKDGGPSVKDPEATDLFPTAIFQVSSHELLLNSKPQSPLISELLLSPEKPLIYDTHYDSSRY